MHFQSQFTLKFKYDYKVKTEVDMIELIGKQNPTLYLIYLKLSTIHSKFGLIGFKLVVHENSC